LTFVVIVKPVSFLATFTDLFTTLRFVTVPSAFAVEPSVFFTRVEFNANSVFSIVAFITFCTGSVWVSGQTVFRKLDASVVFVQIETFFTAFAHLSTAFSFLILPFIILIKESPVNTVRIRNDFNTNSFLDFISLSALITSSIGFSINAVFWQFSAGVILSQVVSLFTAFADLNTSFGFVSVPSFFDLFKVSVLGTVIFRFFDNTFDANSILNFVSFSAFGAYSIRFSSKTVSW
jgi:hypothetical protein